jgi:CRISPR-associated protein Cmr6
MEANMNRTLEQHRAKFALDTINKEKSNADNAAAYGRNVKRLPAMILNNGLGQAMAFLLADDKTPSKVFYKDMQTWLCGVCDDTHPRRVYLNADLIKELMDGDRSSYIQAQQEALRLLTWMKKVADAYLPKSGGRGTWEKAAIKQLHGKDGNKMPNRYLPLYDKLKRQGTEPRPMEPTANTGLLFDKFCDHWSGPKGQNPWKPETPKPKAVKHLFLEAIVKQFKENDSTEDLLDQYHKRRTLLLDNCSGKSENFTTEWRFVSGLGMGHVLETGFVWHKILGVPYLPGSSVKGLMRSFGEQSGNKDLTRLFGPAEEEAKAKPNTGVLIVFDALPVKKPVLEVDVMNPHYGDYYKDSKIPPADYLSPNQIFFLAVAPDVTFSFALGVRKDGIADDIATGFSILGGALDELGAGGKTAVGYGYMSEIKREVASHETKTKD